MGGVSRSFGCSPQCSVFPGSVFLVVFSKYFFDFACQLFNTLHKGQCVQVVLLLEISYGNVKHHDSVVPFCALVLESLLVFVEAVVDELRGTSEDFFLFRRHGQLVNVAANAESDAYSVVVGHCVGLAYYGYCR